MKTPCLVSVCQLAVDLENNPLTLESAGEVTCYVPSLCTAVDCCVEVPALDMSFHTFLSIDPCQYMLKIGIEKYSFQKSLDELSLGKFHCGYVWLNQQMFGKFQYVYIFMAAATN